MYEGIKHMKEKLELLCEDRTYCDECPAFKICDKNLHIQAKQEYKELTGEEY